MWSATWNRLRHSKGRLALTACAVAVGVTFLTASLVLADSTRAALDGSYAQTYAGVDVVVRGPEPLGESPSGNGATPLPWSTADQLRAVAGVRQVEGRLSSVAQLSAAGQDGNGQPAIATAVPADTDNSALEIRAGRLPGGPGEVAVDAAAAAALGLEPGDRVGVLLPSGPLEATIAGTVGFGRLDGLTGGARVLFDRATAMATFGGDGFADLLVRAAGDVSAEQLRDRIAAALGPDLEVLTAAQAARRDAAAASRQTAMVSHVVLGVAVVALLVGGFLIANTFRMLVGQRNRELALLRAVGATRRQVRWSVLAEAAATGAIGAVLGVGFGVGAGALLASSSAGLMPGLPPMSPTVTPLPAMAGLLAGTAVAMLAGQGAARHAVNVPPVAAMRAMSTAEGRPSRTRLIIGVLLGAAAAFLPAAGVAGGRPPLLLGGAAAMILATAALFPFVTRSALEALSRPVARTGIAGGLARQQSLAAPRRIAATAAALAVTLGLVVFLLVGNASLSAATSSLLTQRQHAEFTIRSTARQGLHDPLFALATELARLPEVATARVVTYGDARVSDASGTESRPRTVSMHIVDPAAAGVLFDVRDTSGDTATLGTGEVAIRETVAVGNDWRIGDALSATFADGTATQLTVAALFTGAVSTDWIVAPATAEAHQPAAYREAFVRLADGVSIDEAAPAVQQIVAAEPSATVLSRDDLVEQTREANRNSLTILTALFSLSLVIGVIGVVNTLSLAVVERVRELGLLRAVGATRRQIRSIIRWEAVLTSTLGAVLGASLGVALAWVTTQAMPDDTVAFSLPVVQVGLAVVATSLLGLAASLFPALRASRIDVLQAVQSH